MPGSKKCQPGCACAKHRKPLCQPGCTCGLHDPAPHAHPCPAGCTCGRHVPRERKKCQPGCTCGHHSRPDLGDSNSYMNLHAKVRRLRGKAAEHACVKHAELGVIKSASSWAQIHGTDGRNPWADYVPLCTSCHRRYDFTEQTRVKLSQAMTPERRAASSARMKRLNAEGKAGWGMYNRTKVAE